MKMSEKIKQKLNRRDFIKTTGLAAAAVASPGIASAQSSSSSIYDVAIIGGGFCGVTAARESVKNGYKTVIVEARNRLGGRTFTTEFDGRPTDLGGTWVHWTQPYVWSEIMRYGLPIEETPGAAAAKMMARRSNGDIQEVDLGAHWEQLEVSAAKYMGATREIFPKPLSPFASDSYKKIDGMSSAERLQSITDISDLDRDILDGFFSTLTGNYHKEAAWIEMVRCYALAGRNLADMNDSISRYRFRDGTAALINAMIADAKPEVRLGTPIEKVSQQKNNVVILTEDGDEIVAKTVISAVPLNVLQDIEWSPGLSSNKLAASAEKHAGNCTKVHVLLKGDHGVIGCLAPSDNPLNWLFTEHAGHGTTHMIGFGPDPEALDVNDTAQVQAAVRRFLPEAEVLQVMGYQWGADPFSQGTWAILRPGQYSKYLKDLQASQDLVIFGNADWANAWRGFIDGAIEQGIFAAREVKKILS
jgi:pseudooxynicotine oxidase